MNLKFFDLKNLIDLLNSELSVLLFDHFYLNRINENSLQFLAEQLLSFNCFNAATDGAIATAPFGFRIWKK